MVGTKNQRDAKIHDGVAGDNAFGRRFLNPFVNRRAVLGGNNAADDFIHELIARAARQRLDIDRAIAELTASAGLLLVTTLNVGLAFDGFQIGDFRRVQIDFNAEFSSHFFNVDFNMHLAHSGENHLLGLGIAGEDDGRVFFRQAVNRGSDFILIPPGFRLHGKRHDRRRNGDFFKNNGVFLVAQRVSRDGFL